jgi:hypothetical protein
MSVTTTLGSTREGQRELAAWWGELAASYLRSYLRHGGPGSASNARQAASTAAHFGRLVLENGGAT